MILSKNVKFLIFLNGKNDEKGRKSGKRLEKMEKGGKRRRKAKEDEKKQKI